MARQSLGKGRTLNHRKGIASVVGGVLVFAILFTVGYAYFANAQQNYKSIQLNANQNAEEHFSINLVNSSNGDLNVSIANTGSITVTMQSITIVNTTTGATSCKPISSTSTTCVIATSPSALDTSNPRLPVSVNSGQTSKQVDTGVKPGSTSSFSYLVKVTSSRGTTESATYPVTSNNFVIAAYQAVAAGLGSLEMVFNSFYWYPYVSGPSTGHCANSYTNLYSCTGGTWKIDINHPNWGSVTPDASNMVFSVQILNNDPNKATVILNPHTSLWVYRSCQSGCGNYFLAQFFIMNVAGDGTVTSTSSYSPITLPPGQNKTVYFGSSCDFSLSGCSSYSATSVQTPIGVYAAFILMDGTKVTNTSSVLYQQNIPFSATVIADNLASTVQTPVACPAGSSTTFQLQLTDGLFSADNINKIVYDASAFSSVSTSNNPSGWTSSITSGVITWTTASSYLAPGGTLTFNWKGTAPSGGSGIQSAFPITIYFTGGTVLTQYSAAGCYSS